jgi:hypothetical protein
VLPVEVLVGSRILCGDLGREKLSRGAIVGDDVAGELNEGGMNMLRKTALFVAAMFAAGTAFAFHCPQDMKKIDDAMAKNPKLTAAQTDEVKKYRTDGEALHKAGKHQESVDTLAKAMKILDVK